MNLLKNIANLSGLNKCFFSTKFSRNGLNKRFFSTKFSWNDFNRTLETYHLSNIQNINADIAADAEDLLNLFKKIAEEKNAGYFNSNWNREEMEQYMDAKSRWFHSLKKINHETLTESQKWSINKFEMGIKISEIEMDLD